MELLTLFFYSFWVGLSGAMMPGPLLAVGIAETPRNGWQTGPVISLGHAVAEIGVVVLISFGIAVLADNPLVARIIAYVGGGALVLMGSMMIYDILNARIRYEAGQGDRLSRARLAGKGITTTLVNPYWFVWWATIGLAMLMESQHLGIIGPVVFYLGHIFSDLVWYTVVSILIWKGRKLLMGKSLRLLLLTCAAFLLFLGVKFIHDGLTGAI